MTAERSRYPKPKSLQRISAQLDTFICEAPSIIATKGTSSNIDRPSYDIAGDILEHHYKILVTIKNLGEVATLNSSSNLHRTVEYLTPDYLAFLRNRENHQAIKTRLELQEKTIEFSEIVKEVLESHKNILLLHRDSKSEKVKNHVGAGTYGDVYKINFNDQNYAIKIFNYRSNSVAHDVSALLKTNGIKNTPEIVAYCSINKYIVMTFVDAIELDKCKEKITAQDIKKHLPQMIETIKELNDAGVFIDRNQSNIMFNPKTGFWFIDYFNDQKHYDFTSSRNSEQLLAEQVFYTLKNIGRLPKKCRSSDLVIQKIEICLEIAEYLTKNEPELLEAIKNFYQKLCENNPSKKINIFNIATIDMDFAINTAEPIIYKSTSLLKKHSSNPKIQELAEKLNKYNLKWIFS